MGFSVTTKAWNRRSSGEPLPFSSSWHSYFAVADVSRAVLALDRCSRWNRIGVTGGSNVDGDLIPTGVTTPFHGFDGKHPIGGTREEPTYWDDEFKATSSVQACPQLHTSIHDTVTG